MFGVAIVAYILVCVLGLVGLLFVVGGLFEWFGLLLCGGCDWLDGSTSVLVLLVGVVGLLWVGWLVVV